MVRFVGSTRPADSTTYTPYSPIEHVLLIKSEDYSIEIVVADIHDS